MKLELEVQNASGSEAIPTEDDFRNWVSLTLDGKGEFILAVRIVDANEMQSLNSQYRGKDKVTNVLSFPAEIPESVTGKLRFKPLGDIVLCAPVVEREAEEQEKPVKNHWAHLTVHGALHLLGHDHQDEKEAEAMESLEREYLSGLGIPDPYGN